MATPIVALVALGLLVAAAPVAATGRDRVVTFVLIENRSGRDVRVRLTADGREATADGREVIVAEVGATRRTPDVREMPPAVTPYPVRELKVMVPRTLARLTVEELNSGARAEYDTPHGTPSDAGFRITIRADGISIARDYRPIR